MTPLQCRRCGNVYRRQEGYAYISWGRGEDELEQMESWSGQWEICGHCLLTLKAWLGIRPTPEEAAAPEPDDHYDIPAPPYSIYNDERLEYAPPYRDGSSIHD
jgi:hypothetical protein